MITQQEQLLNKAVEQSVELAPKKKSSSLAALTGESEPWTAFYLPSVPYNALKLPGASYLAFYKNYQTHKCFVLKNWLVQLNFSTLRYHHQRLALNQ